MGVTFDKARNKYRASIQVNGKTKHIGRYDTKLKATRALNKYRRENTVTPINHINVKNAGVNGKGEIVPVQVKEDVHFEKELSKIPVDQPMPEFDIYFPIGEEKPSIWDKIKSIWRSTKHRS